MLVSTAWRKVQILNFRQSYTADRRYLANQKNCDTMTHYTMLTIKQQILMLKTALYPQC